MNKWPVVQLGTVLRPVPRPVAVRPDDVYREIGIRSHGKGIFHKAPVSGLELGSKKVFWVEPGDFVLNIVFAWEGAVAILSGAEKGMIGSHRFPTFRPDELRLDARFLLAFFRTARGLEMLGRVSPGGAGRNRTLSRAAFLKLEIPLPPLAKQRQLVERIDDLALKIHDARSTRKEIAQDSDTLLVAMAHRADWDASIKERNGWRRIRLSEVVRFVDDSHKVEPDRSYPNVGIYSFGRGLFRKQPIDGLATSAKALRRIKKGQFIYSRLFAFEGAYGQVTSEYDGSFVSQEYPTFDCDPTHVRVEFLAAYFRPAHVWKAVAAGSKGLGDRRQRVQAAQLLQHELWLPPISWQDRLAQVQAEVDVLKHVHEETASQWDALMPSILAKAFKGEL